MQLFGICRAPSRMDAGGKARSSNAACLRIAVLLAAGIQLSSLTGCAHPPVRAELVSAPDRLALDRVVDEVIELYRLPGIAVGVIHEGEVIYTRTSGELIAGSGQRVDADTLFKIASNSKAMTTGMLARLVDAGKLRWNDPVVQHLPAFRMSDPWVTREMQVRDLLIHNSGLRAGAGDLMLWPEPNLFTRADIIAGLAYLKPIDSFRSRYSYDNLMYVVAGELAAAAAGISYEELVRREVFEPVGMTRCQVGEWSRDEVGNVAQPHMRKGDQNLVIRSDEQIIPVSTSAAAGGIRCSLNDMLAWMRMWLDPTLKSDRGEPWISIAQREALWAAQTPLSVGKRQREWFNTRFNAYGFGWRLSDVDGVLSVAHTGTLAGMYSALTLLPETRSGFVFLINGDAGEARVVLTAALLKQFTEPKVALPVAHYAEVLARDGQEEVNSAPLPDTSSRVPARTEDFGERLGIYHDPWFGEVTICANSERIVFSSAKSPRLKGDVMQVGERLLVDWYDESTPVEAWLHFEQPEQSPTIKFTMTKVDPKADFSYDYEDLAFTRIGDCP
jgi:CubicO group peptidase (beta-lactamase class C family)